MATDLSSVMTLLDVGKTHLGKAPLEFATNLHKRNGILRFSGWEMANQLTSHIFQKTVSLPSASPRAIGEGATTTKAQVQQGQESLSYYQGKSYCDVIMQSILGAGFSKYRYDWDMLASEGYGQSLATAIFNGAGTDADPMRGLATRYSAVTANQVWDAGCTTDDVCTSIWIIQPGPGKFSLLFGEGAKPQSPNGEFSGGFINMRDLGLQTLITSTTTLASMENFVTLFEIFWGMCVYNDKACQRIASIGTGTSEGTGLPDPDMVIAAIGELPDPEGEKYIFANHTGVRLLKKAVVNKNIFTSTPDKYGQMRDSFYNVPIVTTEAITSTEDDL